MLLFSLMNVRNKITKNAILICLITAVSIFWTGSGYINWLYGLFDYFSSETIDITCNIVDYICQAAGMGLIALYIHKNPDGLIRVLPWIVGGELISMSLAVFSSVAIPKLILGFVMDIFCGMLIGGYLMLITSFLRMHGIIYGIAGAVGGIASYLIVLPLGGRLYTGDLAYIVYVITAIVLIVLIRCIDCEKARSLAKEAATEGDRKIPILCFAFIILACATMNMGYMQPMADVSNGEISVELARAFSAVGLIIAGIVIAYSRHCGLILCVCSLLNPFICIALMTYSALKTPLWIVTYIFTGFYSIFCIVVFADMAEEYGLWVAGLGMMSRRIGEIIGSGTGMLLSKHPVVLIGINTVFFIGTIFAAAMFWRYVYNDNTKPAVAADEIGKSMEDIFLEFAMKYDISDREKDVLKCILEGKSNSETAGELFISENTVKFHIKNILKKTGTSNRKELRSLWQAN